MPDAPAGDALYPRPGTMGDESSKDGTNGGPVRRAHRDHDLAHRHEVVGRERLADEVREVRSLHTPPSVISPTAIRPGCSGASDSTKHGSSDHPTSPSVTSTRENNGSDSQETSSTT